MKEMNSTDTTDLEENSTSGLGYASQLVSMTGVSVASSQMNSTAESSGLFIKLRIAPGPTVRTSVQEAPRLAERSWKRLAARARQSAKKEGLKPSDVDRAIRRSRYGQ